MKENGAAGRAASVLIVDDQTHNRELLKVMLMPEGFELSTAASGEDALKAVAENPPDLILLDVMMPGMSGHEVAAKLKGDPVSTHIPIILITANDDRADRLVGLSAGADDFLTKPVDRAELSVRVRNLLRVKIYGDELRATLGALAAVNEELDERTNETALAQGFADAATARLARLQSITAALSNTVTQDEVAALVLSEAIVALECEAGAVVIAEDSGALGLLRESGALDPVMRSFSEIQSVDACCPYVDAVEKCIPLYLESFEEMFARYPSFKNVA